MSRESVIADRIIKLDPAGFQNLSQELLTQSYGYNKPVHRGSASHSAATAPGTPDTIWVLPHQQFAYLECGHYPDRGKAKRKIEADIQKCLAAEKSELSPGQLVKIAIAYSCRRLSSADIAYLESIDERVDLVGVDEMAMLLAHRFPNLAREHLGVEVSSGQVMSPDEFESAVEKSSFASTLRVDLLGRENDVSELLAALESNQFVLVHGQPGVGKTRLCMEVLRRYADATGACPLVVQSNKLPIWNDLEIDIPKESSSVLLLDDANELSDLGGVASFVAKKDNVKALMTVRNYALEHVVSNISKFCKPCCFRVASLAEETALKVIENGFGIAKGRASADIYRLSRGNMRLACAASDAAKERGIEVFSTLPNLIEACYENKISNLNGVYVKAATVVSVLGPHRLEENNDLEQLLSKVGVSHRCYVDACAALCHEELIDVCQNLVAVSPGEQVLKDYLLYRAFVAEKSLSLSDIDALECGESQCFQIVKVLVNNFFSEELIRDVETQLNDIWTSAGEAKRWRMVERYHSLLGEKGLNLILEAIEGSEPGNHDYMACLFEKDTNRFPPQSKVLNALTPFLHESSLGDPEELLLMAIEKDILPPLEVKSVLTTTMCFNEGSYANDFQYEKEVLGCLADKFFKTEESKYAVLFISYAKAVLSPTFESSTLAENKVRFVYGNHFYSEAMVELRRQAINSLYRFRGRSDFTKSCDCVIVGLRGIPGDDGAGRLWKATLDVAYREYVCHIETIGDYGLPGFAHLENALISQGIIGEEGLPILSATAQMRIATLIFADDGRINGISDKLVSVIGHASSKELTAAISLVCNASLQGGNAVPPHILGEVIDHGIDALSESAEEVMRSGIPSFAISSALILRWIEVYGVVRIRGLVLEYRTNDAASWLGLIDETRYWHLGASSELAQDIVLGAAECGETVSCSVALEIESAVPGFFVRYANGAIRNQQGDQYGLYKLLPRNISDEGQRALVSSPEILSLMETILLSLAHERNFYWPEDLLQIVVAHDESFPERSVPVLLESGSSSALKVLGRAIWREGRGEAATDRVWRSVVEHAKFSPCRALKDFLGYATEHYEDSTVSWLASRSVYDGKLVDYLPDIAMEMPIGMRSEYLELLCRGGICPEELKKVPMYMSSFGLSWSGSEIPLLQEKADCIKQTIKNLTGVAYLKHRMVLQEELEWLKKRMSDVEVSEFLKAY